MIQNYKAKILNIKNIFVQEIKIFSKINKNMLIINVFLVSILVYLSSLPTLQILPSNIEKIITPSPNIQEDYDLIYNLILSFISAEMVWFASAYIPERKRIIKLNKLLEKDILDSILFLCALKKIVKEENYSYLVGMNNGKYYKIELEYTILKRKEERQHCHYIFSLEAIKEHVIIKRLNDSIVNNDLQLDMLELRKIINSTLKNLSYAVEGNSKILSLGDLEYVENDCEDLKKYLKEREKEIRLESFNIHEENPKRIEQISNNLNSYGLKIS